MEAYVAVFDIGTTAVKGVLVNNQAKITGEYSISLETHYGENGEIEQNTIDWWNAIKDISKHWWSDLNVDSKKVKSITFSGQMEDVIPVSNGILHSKAILYSDTRAYQEAKYINTAFPTIHEKIANTVRASTPLAKLLWIEKHNKDLYDKANCFLFNAKDTIIYRLTGSLVADPTTSATTGMMNLKTRQWDLEIIEKFGIKLDQLPTLLNAEEVAGYVTKEAAKETGFAESTPVLCGSGDAGASTMGAAAVHPDDTYFYIGTTGWAAIVNEGIQSVNNESIFYLAHLPNETTISIAPLLNAGNVHRWAVESFVEDTKENKYERFEHLVKATSAGSKGVLFLPYLNGERFPFNDSDARGAFWGIGPTVEKSDLARSVIEGICFSFKQLLDLLTGENSKGTLTLIGGGSKSESWCQILADIIGRPVRVPVDSEYMPSLGAGSSAFIQLGWAKDYSDFCDRFLANFKTKTYHPTTSHSDVYKENYKTYLKLYPSMKGIYK